MKVKFNGNRLAQLKLSKEVEDEVKKIITLFISKVLGKSSHVDNTKGNDGAKGHELERLFELHKNRKTEPDFGLIELKIKSPKTTLGDWSPNLGIYDIGKLKTKDGRKTKLEYLMDYGQKNNEDKYHLTGPFYFNRVHPRTNLKITIKEEGLFLTDMSNGIDIIGWSKELLEANISNKFKHGIAVVKETKGIFTDLNFHLGFDLEKFFELIQKDEIIYDPGTSLKRPYSQFRFRTGVGGLPSINYKELLE